MTRNVPATIFILILWAWGAAGCASSDNENDLQALVDKANASAERFAADPDMTWFREYLDDAQAILIVPNMFKAGYIIGGTGGSGVMLAR
jgi:lipid-binding SYLF domain-containing protein